MSVCEERSDDLRRHSRISTSVSTAISNNAAVNATHFAIRFARHRRARTGFYMGVYRIENMTSLGNKVTKSRVTLVQCMDAKAPFYFSKSLVAKVKIDPAVELELLRRR